MNESGKKFTIDDISKMNERFKPRRHRLNSPEWSNNSTQWNALRKSPDGRTSLKFPFGNTYCNSFVEYWETLPDKENMGFLGFSDDKKYKEHKFTYLRNFDEVELNNWLETIGNAVAICDYLHLTYALNYIKVDGDPSEHLTEIAELRKKAKIYEANQEPSEATFQAADELTSYCNKFIRNSKIFNKIDSIIAPPSSTPGKKYYLAERIARELAKIFNWENLQCAIISTNRDGLKNLTYAEKLPALIKSIFVTKPNVIQNKSILVLDDLYQSGTTMNYIGKLMLDNHANIVYGLACEKTLTNDD